MAAAAIFHSPRNAPLAASKYIADVSRTWVWNDIGTASFQMPRSVPNIATLLAWGNIVRIVEDGLPTWVGTIEERVWSSGGVRVELRSMEQLLRGHITDQGLTFGENGGMAVGDIVRALALNAWGNGWSPISLGGIAGATKQFKQYDYAALLDALQDLAAESKSSFWVDENLLLHFALERGRYHADQPLRENRDLVNVTTTETRAEVLTNIIALGAGADLVDQPKLLLQYTDQPFFVAEVVDFSDAIDQLSLTVPTTEALKARLLPKVRIEADVVNSSSNWQKLRMGDTLPLGVYTDVYRVFDAKVIGQEVAKGQAMRCVFELVLPLPTQAPTTWRIS